MRHPFLVLLDVQLAQTDVETYYEYYYRQKRMKRQLLQLVMLAAALMTGRYVLLETVSNDFCSYVSQIGDLATASLPHSSPIPRGLPGCAANGATGATPVLRMLSGLGKSRHCNSHLRLVWL